MKKLANERRWWLTKFSRGGWTMGAPMLVGIKKWDAHSAMLVRMGYLDKDGLMFRITDAGRAALRETPEGGGE